MGSVEVRPEGQGPQGDGTRERHSWSGRSVTRAKRLGFWFRLGGMLILCGWIIMAIDWEQLWPPLRDADLLLLSAVIPLRIFGVALSAVKWQKLLSVHQLGYRFRDLFRWSLATVFLSQFLPTTIGGDGYRIYKTWTNGRGGGYAATAVLVDRYTGLLALTALGCVAAVWAYFRTGNSFVIGFLLMSGIALVAAVPVLSALLRLRPRIHQRLHPRLQSLASRLEEMLREVRAHPRTLVTVMSYSLVFHLVRAVDVWITLLAVGTLLNFIGIVFAEAFVQIMGSLPISIGGIGVMEGSFMIALEPFGIVAETALAAMLLRRAIDVPMAALGASCYFMDGRRPVVGIGSRES